MKLIHPVPNFKDIEFNTKQIPPRFAKKTVQEAYGMLQSEIKKFKAQAMLFTNLKFDKSGNVFGRNGIGSQVVLQYIKDGNRKLLISDKYIRTADNIYAMALMIQYNRKSNQLGVRSRQIILNPEI